MPNSNPCVLCGASIINKKLYGHNVCTKCKAKLGLLTDETISRHLANFKKTKEQPSYQAEIEWRLAFVEQDYLKKKIKLLHVLDRLKQL